MITHSNIDSWKHYSGLFNILYIAAKTSYKVAAQADMENNVRSKCIAMLSVVTDTVM